MNISKLKKEFEFELTDNILRYWVNEVYDPQRKTFFGRITFEGKKFADAPLSAVMVTRILWTFSAAYHLFPTAVNRKMAETAYNLIKTWFIDKQNGGIYWSIFPDGKVKDTKKQFYAQAFLIYALSEYYLAFGDESAKKLAVTTFSLMEKYAYDPVYGGYFEAKTADWKETDDQYISPADIGIKKSMNTHLHILEAYTGLSRVYVDARLRNRLEELIQLFLQKIVDMKTGHLVLFFEKDWTARSQIDSYGHDIEATWLLYEAAEATGKEEIVKAVLPAIKKMLETTIGEGISPQGGIYYEKNNGHLQQQFDWWPQAEAVVGFFNGALLFNDEKYMDYCQKTWSFIHRHITDKKQGEWFWGVDAKLQPLEMDKVNGWKAPYHNGRMCMQMIRRIDSNY